MGKYLGVLIAALMSMIGFAQNDCSSPLVVCGNEGFNNIEVSGPGVQELSGANSCASMEHNSLWFDVTIKTGGTLAFILKPESSDINEDFDFFVFGPNVTCGNIGQSIRCSTTNPVAAGLTSNHTGMSTTATDTSEGPGPDGNSFVKAIDANAGERYFIVIDRPIGSSNFTIEWTGTAKFNEAPTVEIPTGTSTDLVECDSVAPFNDLQTVFDLTQNNFIVGGQANVTVSYYDNNTDANTGTNPISNADNYTNTVNNQLIYARLENTITGCYSVDSFKLSVSSGPSLQVGIVEECDEDNDGFATFDLTQLNDRILMSGNPSDYQISYHPTQSDAENNTGVLSNVYTNTIASYQELFARVVSNVNSFCVSTTSVRLQVKSVPVITDLVELKQCDDDTDARTLFNLEEVKSKISADYLNETITFYETLAGAHSGVNAILSIEAYENQTPANDTIWARVVNLNDCYKIAEVKLVVAATNIPADFIREIKECDDLVDDDDTDGFANFDFTNVDAEIRGLFSGSGQQIQVTYYENIENALAEVNKISNIQNYRNTTPFQQEIYVRVDSNIDNSCLGLGHHLTLLVNPVPDFQINAPQFICFRTTALLEVISQQMVTTEWRIKNNAQVLGTGSSLQISTNGTYEALVTNTLTGCTKLKEVTVLLSGSPIITREDIVVIDDFSGSANQQYSVKIKKENLGAGSYEFHLEKENGIVYPFQDEALFDNLEGGKYFLTVRDKNGCQPDASLTFYILQYPRFFTPNDDGKNDVWTIKGVNKDLYKEGDIVVYDRYGKILFKDSVFGPGWDGNSQGRELPSNDYWFSLNLIDVANENYTYEGHFSLLRK